MDKKNPGTIIPGFVSRIDIYYATDCGKEAIRLSSNR
jgi:hypothetical protein